jgi:glycosyltransferase involved in cell wall biosynthesis
MVVLEAQACGLPCVVNELGGPKEIIKNGETGWVVRGQDEASWLHCLQEILEKQKQDVDLFKNFGLKAREYVLQNSTWPEILPDFFKDCETHHQSSELSTTPMLKI